MEALKNHVENFINKGGKIKPAKDDAILTEIRKIVGNDWATNDDGITVTYSHDLSALSEPKRPNYLVIQKALEEFENNGHNDNKIGSFLAVS